ncbi:tRNA preQ1(34) S-adenosylmethionine ribosyltransferase-isomerase QueA [Synechococcus elongatus IITB4]|uniref:tRNA preQ1(34) S-adenosylmethionine ribosyltransferase-isomerase QueA n=1 Tax=Synechococcus elongatus TaxID=32046 RepID=UPI0030D4E044
MNESSPSDWQLDAYDYELPADRIAQTAVEPRDHARLLVFPDREQLWHRHFYDLPQLLNPGDLLIINDTRVIPARLYGQKIDTGVPVEVLLVEEHGPGYWLTLVKPGKRLKPGAAIAFGPNPEDPLLVADVEASDPATGGRWLRFRGEPEAFWSRLATLGEMPLPPYIHTSSSDPERYQTVYSREMGAVAAPTAGLHFTPELLTTLADMGIATAPVTLHVGIGTFRSVDVEDIRQHQMHSERMVVPAATVEKIQATKAAGGRVIAVGTTSVRAIEGAAASGELKPGSDRVNLFIYPGYRWRIIDGLITNFHLPRSSLMMLVSSLIGRDRLLSAYATAIAEQYRFYSFGDAMLILPDAKLP